MGLKAVSLASRRDGGGDEWETAAGVAWGQISAPPSV